MQSQPSPWVKGALAASGIFVSIVGIGSSVLWNSLVDRLESLEQQVVSNRGRINNISERAAKIVEYEINHERAAERCFARLDRLEDQVLGLATNPRSRPDAFTSSDGQRLRALIDSNESRLDAVERCCDKTSQ